MHYKGPSIGMIVCACLCGAASSSADVITDWNARTAQAVGAATGAAARLAGTGLLDFAMVHAAMHDAIQAFEHRFETYGPPIEGATGSSVAAAAAAAHDVLVVLFPPQVGSIDSFYTTYLASQGLTGDPEWRSVKPRQQTSWPCGRTTGAFRPPSIRFSAAPIRANGDLSELKAIKLQCPQCRASVAFPIARIEALSIPAACPGCSAEWRRGSHEIEISLNNIVHALNTWRRVESELKPAFDLRFEMSPLASTD